MRPGGNRRGRSPSDREAATQRRRRAPIRRWRSRVGEDMRPAGSSRGRGRPPVRGWRHPAGIGSRNAGHATATEARRGARRRDQRDPPRRDRPPLLHPGEAPLRPLAAQRQDHPVLAGARIVVQRQAGAHPRDLRPPSRRLALLGERALHGGRRLRAGRPPLSPRIPRLAGLGRHPRPPDHRLGGAASLLASGRLAQQARRGHLSPGRRRLVERAPEAVSPPERDQLRPRALTPPALLVQHRHRPPHDPQGPLGLHPRLSPHRRPAAGSAPRTPAAPSTGTTSTSTARPPDSRARAGPSPAARSGSPPGGSGR